MIVVDTSALIAVVNHEPERLRFLEIISAADTCLISSVSILETHMVAFGRLGNDGSTRLSLWFASFTPLIVAFDDAQALAAIAAFRKYGKGTHATARLNFGDCATYALASTRNLPLLYKGDDFAATDIVAAA